MRAVLLFLVGVAWAVAVDLPNLSEEGGDPYTVLGDVAVGLLMQWTGLVLLHRRGTGRSGPFLYGAGLLWFVGSGVPEPLFWLTFPGRGWYEPLLVTVILGYPTGRLLGLVDRVIVGSLVVAFLARSLVRAFAFDPGAMFGRDGWHNPALVFWDERLWGSVEDAVIVVSALCAVGIVLVCLRRWRAASAPSRRTLAPVLASGLAIAPLLGWSALTTPINAFGLPMPDPAWTVWFQIVMRAVVPLAILVGIVRLQSARSSLADLLVELDAGVPVGRLEEALRRHLRDPSLRLAFARPDGRLVDATGTPVQLPGGTGERRVTGIDDARGIPFAYIVHDAALTEDPELVRAVGAAARLSLENERLQAEVRAQLLELRDLSARLVEASDAERRRIERDLHDGAQQRLVTLALRLRVARDQARTSDGAVAQMLAEASTELGGALRDLRELARGIHPAVLARDGLAGAVRALAQRCTVPVTATVPDVHCADATIVTVYYVIAEALTNIARHASATSAQVTVARADERLVVTVVDDGSGGATPGAGTGLSGLRDRVEAVGGSLQIVSRPGEGTSVRADLPCA